MPAWASFGIIAGILSLVVTLTANFSVLWIRPADLCRAGPPVLLLTGLIALVVFVFLAGSAGFATGRAGAIIGDAALAGLLVGAISGCALVASTLFVSSTTQRLQQLSAQCPQTRSFTRGFFFYVGPTPPSGAPTLPPGLPTPPPGLFTTPPPGVVVPPSGTDAVGQTIGLIVTVGFGMGLATGAAALGGILGAAARHRSG